VACGCTLPARSTAWWDGAGRSTTCLTCCPAPDGSATGKRGAPTTALGDALETGTTPSGSAGASALREYERRHTRRAERIDQRWGRLAGVVKFLSDDPQSIQAWAKGSEGERRLATSLTEGVGNRAVLLHDRKVPGTRGNIDHIAIAAS